MSKAKVYILKNEQTGEELEFCGIRAAAEYIGCVPSTIYIYSKCSKPYKGWNISIGGTCELPKAEKPASPYRTERKNPKRMFKDADFWEFYKFFKNTNTVCINKTYRFNVSLDVDLHYVKKMLEKSVEYFIGDDQNFQKKYTLIVKIPEFGYTENTKHKVNDRLIYFELHLMFTNHYEFKKEIKYYFSFSF